MEIWQMVVSLCAGAITIITFVDKIGVTKTMKETKKDHGRVEYLVDMVTEINDIVQKHSSLQEAQTKAILAILRNQLYDSFRKNRKIASWTDDECRIQTLMHDAYKILGGNGEEEIWWEKKKRWQIVSQDEYDDILLESNISNIS